MRISVAACLLSWLGIAAPCRGQVQTSPRDCEKVNDTPSSRPQFLLDRSQEDWSVLCNRALRIDRWDRIKYVRLGQGQSYLSFGGELRSEYDVYSNENWGAAPQDDNGYSLNRLMGHADVHIGEHVRAFAELRDATPNPLSLDALWKTLWKRPSWANPRGPKRLAGELEVGHAVTQGRWDNSIIGPRVRRGQRAARQCGISVSPCRLRGTPR